MSGMIALPMQSACQLVCTRWKAARRRWVARTRMLDQLKILVMRVVSGDRDRLLVIITTDARPEREAKLAQIASNTSPPTQLRIWT